MGRAAVLATLALAACQVENQHAGDLEGQGRFAYLDGLRVDSMGTMESCRDLELWLFSNDADDNPDATVWFELPGPHYPGRRYDKGTKATSGVVDGWLASGHITITDWRRRAYGDLTKVTATFEFDASFLFIDYFIPRDAWWGDLREPTSDRIRGEITVHFHEWMDGRCDPWDRIQGTFDRPLETWSVDWGTRADDHLELPVEYVGLQDTTLTVYGTQVRVEQPTALSANHVCRVHANEAPYGSGRCTGQPAAVVGEDILTEFRSRDGDWPIWLQDSFGLWPQLSVPDLELQPRITAPDEDAWLDWEAPLTVRWEEWAGSDETLTLRVEDAGGLPLHEDEVPDVGEAIVDPVDLDGYWGPITLWLYRERDIGLELDVGVESSLTLLAAGRVDLFLVPEQPWEFPDPELGTEDWAVPEVVVEVDAKGESLHALSSYRASDGVHLAWRRTAPTGEHVERRVLDLSSLAWDPVHTSASLELPYQGSVWISGRGSSSLITTNLDDDDGHHPVGLLFDGSGSVTELVPIGMTPTERAWQIGTLLRSDGTALVAARDDEHDLYASEDGAPFQLAAAGSYPADLQLFDRGGTVVALAGNGIDGFIWTPGVGFELWSVDEDMDHTALHCDTFGAVDDDLVVHVLCDDPPLLYGRWSLLTGDLLGDLEVVFYDTWGFAEDLHTWQVATAPDGTVWVLYTFECEHGLCPALFTRRGADDWEGPILPGWAEGAVRLFADLDGVPHLVYAPTVPGWSRSVEILHTWEEGE